MLGPSNHVQQVWICCLYMSFRNRKNPLQRSEWSLVQLEIATASFWLSLHLFFSRAFASRKVWRSFLFLWVWKTFTGISATNQRCSIESMSQRCHQQTEYKTACSKHTFCKGESERKLFFIDRQVMHFIYRKLLKTGFCIIWDF